MSSTEREANTRRKGGACRASRFLPGLRHPWRGMGAEPGSKPRTHVSLPCSARACPRPREKRWLSSPRTRSRLSGRAPGEGRESHPTYHAGRGTGTAQVSWLSGFGHVPLAQFRSWSRQAREVPRPGHENRVPTRAPPGPSRKSAAARPASSGTPGTIHQDAPAPPQGN